MLIFGATKFNNLRNVRQFYATKFFNYFPILLDSGAVSITKFPNNKHSTKQNSMDPTAVVFDGKIDRYNGVTVDTNTEHVPAQISFLDILKNSLAHWHNTKRRTIWFKVSLKDSQFIPILAENGFDFHHAREGFVMMVKWLPNDQTSNIPIYAHTMIGVGGLVTNEHNQILAIREQHAIVPGMWKLPGGYVEPNENLDDAVIREVHEETGIQTTFETVISVRHSRGYNFGCSDMYIVMALKPIVTSTNSTAEHAIQICPREIAESKWMSFDEFLNNPKVHDLNRGLLRTYLDYKERGLKITCKEVIHPQFRKPYDLYYINTAASNDSKL